MIIEQYIKPDFSPIIQLLKESNLPTSDLEAGKQDFYVAYNANSIIGCIGIEKYKPQGLIRSFAVANDFKNKGFGKELYNHIIEHALREGFTKLFLLTTTADKYFEAKGWKRTERETVPLAMHGSKEFSEICPSTAICMELSLIPEMAAEIFSDGFNCAQAVFYPFALQSGILPENALKLATGFGAGMVYQGETCGAITGAMMAIGMASGRSRIEDYDAKEKTYMLINDLYKRFRKKHGTILCKELLKLENTQPESWAKAGEERKFDTACPLFVKDAATITEEIIKSLMTE
jgi:C_GCAxxG_C_C family probable redox protein